MKFVLVVLSGVADLPVAALKDRTPLQVARTPALDALARSGRVGTVATTPPGEHSGSDAALLTLLGYDTKRYPLRRGALEAIGAGIDLSPQDLVFRGNLVSLYNEKIADLTAGRISTDEAHVLLDELSKEVGDDAIRIHPLTRYRFLAIVKGGRSLRVQTAPPHVAVGKAVREVYPSGEDGGRFARLLDTSRKVLGGHEINAVRVDLGENPANFVWLWGEGADVDLPTLVTTFGVSGVCVAGAPLARGVGRKVGLDVIDVPGATGDLDTDLDGKAEAALRALERSDFVFVHVQAANEASHLHDPMMKVEVIQQADRHLIEPIRDGLDRLDDGYRIVIASDHVTASDRDEPILGSAPFLIAGKDISTVREYPFDEEHAARSDLQIEDGPALMEFFLGRPRRAPG